MKTVCIYETSDHFMALSAKELLESKDIIVIMPTEHITGVLPHYALATAGHKLRVSEKDALKAIEILDQFIIQQPGGSDDKIHTPHCGLICPRCHSKEITEIIVPRSRLIARLFLFLEIPIPAKNRSYQCHKCKHTWE